MSLVPLGNRRRLPEKGNPRGGPEEMSPGVASLRGNLGGPVRLPCLLHAQDDSQGVRAAAEVRRPDIRAEVLLQSRRHGD